MAEKYNGWEVIRPLGKGGQGTVYLVRNPKRGEQLLGLQARVKQTLSRINLGVAVKDDDPLTLAKDLVALGGPDPSHELAALKLFDLPTEDEEQQKRAVGRLEAEVTALEKLKHPAILKLLATDPFKRYIVVEYHPGGTLNKHLSSYRGDVLRSLVAFRPLVEAVAAIHEQGAVHRDIKTENIFVAADGRLVLGDFGIVIFTKGDNGYRFTTTYEKVGTSYWMAPWAYKPERLAIEDVTPSLDIFPLAKILWSMISGRDGFPFWEIDRDENKLEKLFPLDPMMPQVSHVLTQCIVREEADCKSSARGLLESVAKLIESARSAGQKPDDGGTWRCRMCGRGHYVETKVAMHASVIGRGDRVPFKLYACDSCGHAEMFEESVSRL